MRRLALPLLLIASTSAYPLAQDGGAFDAASVKKRAFTGAVPQVSMSRLGGSASRR